MTRQLLCLECGEHAYVHPGDYHNGFRQRKVKLIAHNPGNLYVEVIPEGEPSKKFKVDVMKCDLCNADISDGTEAIARTMWQGTEPQFWEHEFGKEVKGQV